MKISACMIVKNEEENILNCIKSFKEYMTEIIVVDTGSTDRTIELAEQMGEGLFDTLARGLCRDRKLCDCKGARRLDFIFGCR